MKRFVPWVVATVATLIAVAAVAVNVLRPPAPPPEIAAEVPVSPATEPAMSTLEPVQPAKPNPETPKLPAHWYWPLVSDKPAAAITPDGLRVMVYTSEEKDGRCVFAGLIERDLASGVEVRRLDLRKHLDPDAPDSRSFGRCPPPTVTQLLFLPDGRLVVAGQLWQYDHSNLFNSDGTPSVSSTIFPMRIMRGGYLWVIDPQTGRVEKTLSGTVGDLSVVVPADGAAKLLVQSPLSLGLRDGTDPGVPFVVIQQLDTTTWKRDWVKVLEPAEAIKVRGAGK